MSDPSTTAEPSARAEDERPPDGAPPPEPERRRGWEELLGRAWRQSRASRYGIAGAVSLLAIVLCCLVFAPYVRLITFAPVVIAAALLGGLGPGLVTTAACAAAATFYWIDPARSFGIAIVADGVAIGAFVLSGALMSGLVELMHRVRHRAEGAHARLHGSLERTRQAHRQAARLAAETRLLFRLAEETARCEAPSEVYEPALDGVRDLLGAERAAILLLDADAVVRVKAWRGLSDSYRATAEGQAPWARDDGELAPVIVADVEHDERMAPHRAVLAAEGIRALAMFPLVQERRSIGKLVLGWTGPRTLSEHDRGLALTIASHVSEALARAAARGELERSVRFSELFTGILAHDLRNPLGAVTMTVQLALAQNTEPRLVMPLSKILSSSLRMGRMIDQLLDFTRVRMGGGLPIEPMSVDLVPIVRQVVDELASARAGSDVRFQHEGSAEGTWDPDRLAQVFSNLIGNALQHGVPGQGVRVHVDGSAPDAVTVEVHNLGAIPAALMPRLFAPLVSARDRPRGTRGLGLGLFISREIVAAHGGTIDVRSDEATGTVFRVVLPRAYEPRPLRAGGGAA